MSGKKGGKEENPQRPRPKVAAVPVSVHKGTKSTSRDAEAPNSYGLKPLSWFLDKGNHGIRADCKVELIKMEGVSSNAFLRTMARCKLSDDVIDVEMLFWNDPPFNVGGAIQVFNNPAEPYTFTVRNVYSKPANEMYKTAWTKVQIHFNHDRSFLWYNGTMIEFDQDLHPAKRNKVIPPGTRECSLCKTPDTIVCIGSDRRIVPPNATLLLQLKCHLNVEWTLNSSCISYLYKYIAKGVDTASAVKITEEP